MLWRVKTYDPHELLDRVLRPRRITACGELELGGLRCRQGRVVFRSCFIVHLNWGRPAQRAGCQNATNTCWIRGDRVVVRAGIMGISRLDSCPLIPDPSLPPQQSRLTSVEWLLMPYFMLTKQPEHVKSRSPCRIFDRGTAG